MAGSPRLRVLRRRVLRELLRVDGGLLRRGLLLAHEGLQRVEAAGGRGEADLGAVEVRPRPALAVGEVVL